MPKSLFTSLAASLLLAACAQPAGASAPFSGGASAAAVSNVSPRKNGPNIFVANRNGPSVLVFPQSASGNVAPSASIAGSHTTLTQPDSLSVDSTGRIFAANDGAVSTSNLPGQPANGDAVNSNVAGTPVNGGAITSGLSGSPVSGVVNSALQGSK